MKKNITINVKLIATIILGIFFCITIYELTISNGKWLETFFGLDETSLFHTYFNGIKSSSPSLHEYATGAYLPVKLLAFRIIGAFLPDAVKIEPVSVMSFLQQSNMLCLFCTCICLCLIAVIIYYKAKFIGFLLFCFEIITVPFMYGFHEGGFPFFELLLLTLFIINYQTKRLPIKELSNICIAIACCLDFYYILFLFLLRKDWKSLLRIIMYIVGVSLAALFVTGGFKSLKEYYLISFRCFISLHTLALIAIIVVLRIIRANDRIIYTVLCFMTYIILSPVYPESILCLIFIPIGFCIFTINDLSLSEGIVDIIAVILLCIPLKYYSCAMVISYIAIAVLIINGILSNSIFIQYEQRYIKKNNNCKRQ